MSQENPISTPGDPVVRAIRLEPTGTVIAVSEATTLDEIRAAVPLFFQQSLRVRETYTTYRGAVIARRTVSLTGAPPERRTVVYLYTPDLEGSPAMFCISAGHILATIRQARRLIDTVLETGSYRYGMPYGGEALEEHRKAVRIAATAGAVRKGERA